MRVAVIVNPASGAGRSIETGRDVACALQAAGHEAVIVESRSGHAEPWLRPALEGIELLVVAGGDGSVRQACTLAAECRVPIYQFPCGTENLLSREFGMDRRVSTLLEAIQRHEIRPVDLCSANGEPFLLMASVGLDAEVVHDLALSRNGSIRHWSYLKPILRQLWRWRPAKVEVEVDKRVLSTQCSALGSKHQAPSTEHWHDHRHPATDNSPGMVVVANCSQYAARLNPCRWADMSDGLLSVAYMPTASRLGVLRWIIRCALRRQRSARGLIEAQGREVVIRADKPFRYQLDGDPPTGGSEVRELRIAIQPGALAVLVPPH